MPSSEPVALVEKVRSAYARIAAIDDPGIFIHLVAEEEAISRAEQLSAPGALRRDLPLLGTLFAVKDNIDVKGLPTTAGCPDFAYVPTETAPSVQKLLDKGALLIGKTNLDQFATGLVGTRTPYAVPRNVFDPKVIPGGSSSGSAVAVARGIVDFALGTDTAGSGRVPAALNGIVGLKPTRGRISTRGVVPACRAQDCVSVFATSVRQGAQVLELLAGYDEEDPYCEELAAKWSPRVQPPPKSFRFAVLGTGDLGSCDSETRRAYEATLLRLKSQGGEPTIIDFAPFALLARSLYEGPWVAQRLEAVAPLLKKDPSRIHPVVKQIVEAGRARSAEEAYRAETERRRCARKLTEVLTPFAFLLLPTIPRPITLEEAYKEPITNNAMLGTFTNFVNLLDLCALAISRGVASDGVPRGVTLVGLPDQDGQLAGFGERLMESEKTNEDASAGAGYSLVVAGAHMSGMVLNHQLVELGGRLLRKTRTAPVYRLFALDTTPPKPGLVRVTDERGASIECEEWELSGEALARFASKLPPPMCLGSVELEDGSSRLGFLCEPRALTGAKEITELGSFRRYLASLGPSA